MPSEGSEPRFPEMRLGWMLKERFQKKTASKMRHEGCLWTGQKMRLVKFTVR